MARPHIVVGGTTGLDHSSCGAAIDAAVDWLRRTQVRPGATVPQLRKLFGLSAQEACRALAEYHLHLARSQ